MIILILVVVVIYFYSIYTPQPTYSTPIGAPIPYSPCTQKVETFQPSLKINDVGLAKPLEGPNVGMHVMHHKMDDMRVESRYKPKTSDSVLFGFISPVVSTTPNDIRGPIDF